MENWDVRANREPRRKYPMKRSLLLAFLLASTLTACSDDDDKLTKQQKDAQLCGYMVMYHGATNCDILRNMHGQTYNSNNTTVQTVTVVNTSNSSGSSSNSTTSN